MKIKIAIIQFDIFWEDRSANLSYLSKLIGSIDENVGLIVLPEMFTTGFSMNPAAFADTMDGDSIIWMRDIASSRNVAICGSIMVEELGKYYNRFIWIGADGSFAKYDKEYLFSPSGEHKVYTPGWDRDIIIYQGWNIIPRICYDLRFPESTRNISKQNHLIIYVASWPNTRRQHWIKLLQARAIENQCYVIGANRIGMDGNKHKYHGDSMIVDYTGTIISHIEIEEGIIMKEIDLEGMLSYRAKLPFLMDQK